MYLQQRKQKLEEEKSKLKGEGKGFVDSPRSTRVENLRSSEYRHSMNDSGEIDNTMNRCDDDSFLAMERMCEKTLHLNNESEILMDLTSLDSPVASRKSLKKLPAVDETHLNDVEAPSFLFNNSSLISPNKHSPLIEPYANRPSTIMEVSEVSSRTCQSSYRTAMTGTESSQYKTAEESLTLNGTLEDESMKIKMPKIRSFYADMSKDSLDVTRPAQQTIDLTKDSLESSSGIESSYEKEDEEVKLNDTLEQIEYMLAQAQKMQEAKTPKPASATPKIVSKTPLAKMLTPAPSSASKYSPLIKFSPVVKNSPVARNSPVDQGFKKPTQSASKQPPSASKLQFSHNKKYQHIESPISRYIKHTPGVPLAVKPKDLPGIGSNSPKTYNFRDSESFQKENDSMKGNQGAYGGSSLPFRAKTKSSAIPQVSFP
jgi:hypothetical protein